MWKSLRGSKVVDWNKQQVRDTATAMLGALPIQARQIIENGSFKGPDIMKIEKKRSPTVTDIKKTECGSNLWSQRSGAKFPRSRYEALPAVGPRSTPRAPRPPSPSSASSSTLPRLKSGAL